MTKKSQKIQRPIDEVAESYAVGCHFKTGHRYNDHPYSFHLRMVANVGFKFSHLIPEKDLATVIAGCWVHDVIEDCRQTYNDVKEATNEEVAELAYALTNEKGKNRKGRANYKYYEGIRDTPYATFIKCCDRIANAQYSKDTNSRMLGLYKKEHNQFVDYLKRGSTYAELFEHLRNIFYEES